MDTAKDSLVVRLDSLIQTAAVAALLGDIVPRVRRRLEASSGPMAWEVLPRVAFGRDLSEAIRSCWIFVIRAGASTGPERHPNSHQRSCSLIGTGAFELHDGTAWRRHTLTSDAHDEGGRRWISIPPSTWHRLRVGSGSWAMVSFHTVAADDLIEENPHDPDRLDGPTRQARYSER